MVVQIWSLSQQLHPSIPRMWRGFQKTIGSPSKKRFRDKEPTAQLPTFFWGGATGRFFCSSCHDHEPAGAVVCTCCVHIASQLFFRGRSGPLSQRGHGLSLNTPGKWFRPMGPETQETWGPKNAPRLSFFASSLLSFYSRGGHLTRIGSRVHTGPLALHEDPFLSTRTSASDSSDFSDCYRIPGLLP